MPEEEKTEPFVVADDVAATSNAPDGFRSYGKFYPIEADRLLKKFEAAGVRFQIELDQKRVYQTIYTFFGGEYVRKIEIIVNNEDDEEALKILNADWKI
ncbi:MAG TPA: hypothetical protein VN873_18030 [Candidatus Angelobacter sp.]|nr:hypothetical protein [Candidatus Angelobacter sp.]